MADEIISNLLVVILDANPVWWGRIVCEGNPSNGHEQQQISLTHCVDSLMVFCNAHLMMKHNNCLSFIVSHTSTSKFVFPKENATDSVNDNAQKDLPSDGKYEGFADVNDVIITELKSLLSTEDSKVDDHSSEVPPTLLASALTMALCYIHRAEKECPVGQKLKSRILVLKAAPDVSTQYMPIMNCIFAAQKSNTVIDACVLDEHSGFLQQAADITGGVYLKVPQTFALLQYLLWVFLPEPSVREQLILPSSVHIDYRAACFCHRRLVDIGFVCSVCLSIYCQFIPLCLTCQTRFKLPALPIVRPKKKKKENTAPGK
ncbi:general transcription factor IIH subunit 3-like isoform X4 [Orbicella faveolata]|uniref:general transcription factor IIH subunit 3-like isoform X3 n=1 Tax=Orbicella faveolata TaxID=48498 RepID=UPI0009E5B6FD|nr:general transcription factor IIH subunit 3-like isoform X3 [Orbicella faveolata]XP_020613661.1 general transcription factor IIH subunit 3-like isoform X4 [Orbicella faveolata]